MKTRDPLIYVLCDPVSGSVRYVGQSRCGERRAYSHCWPQHLARNHTVCDQWVKAQLAQGLTPLVVIVERCTEEHINDRERWWIAFAKAWGCDLTNVASGGRNGSGWKWSDESRARQKAIQSHPATKEKIRAAALASGGRDRQSQSTRAAWADPAQRAQRGRAISDAYTRPDVRERHRAGLSAARTTPEARAKRKALHLRTDVHARISAAQKAAQSRPDTKAKKRATMSRPDVRERHRAATKAAMANPDIRRRQLVGMLVSWADPVVKARRVAARWGSPPPVPRMRINLARTGVLP